MVLIFGIAATAAAVIRAYNALAPSSTKVIAGSIRQVTGVILSIAEAINKVLNALQGIAQVRTPQVAAAGGSPLRSSVVVRGDD